MSYFTVLWKTLFFYFLITVIYRIMGKREVGELSIMDLIVSIFIAELAAISIDNYKQNIFLSVVPILALVIVQLVVSRISLKSAKIRSILDGDPSVIIERGKVNFKEMLKQRYNLDDLLVQLRNRGIKSIEEVDYAILETSGKLSVFRRDDDKNRVYPLPIIIDGKVQKDVLYQIGKDMVWLMDTLNRENYQLEDVFYGFYQKKKLFLIRKEAIK
ncbi:MAG TPA: DUF421 domain-containing protein [Candidatus Faecimonas gallistercoris]|nr:DUF421 domain-containing protein [Candidatus Faecimonas gallistercoris]